MAARDGASLGSQSGNNIELQSAPGRFETLEALDGSLVDKNSPNPQADLLYLRDGDPRVVALESLISSITIPGQQHNVAVAAGMSAVDTAVGISLSVAGRQQKGERKSPVLAYGKDLYSQSTRLFQDLKNMGVLAYSFDSGDSEEIDRIIDGDTPPPDVMFVETVANTPNMPVADVYRLVEWGRSEEGKGTVLIFDNTLPKKTGVDFDEILDPEDKVLVVESITKAELLNSSVGVGGIIYSKNEELIHQVRRHRTTHGPVISGAAADFYRGAIESTLPGFHDRNRALFASTGKIALALEEARQELGDKADFDISFPTLPTHPNFDYAAEHLPDGGSPVVFIGSNDMYEGAGKDLLDRITSHPRIREQIREQSYFGQSFGFPEATYLYYPDFFYVRFSGGYDMDNDAFAVALKEAAADK